ncbi:hypothetical protein V5O48_012526 [Marasmius crinis-equi]|uniref:BZIP domain-containing protein n=1 Tax=Marasmius crinis-equi TaxID=585013 RepID=A0ABR3F2L9_9AGAR
MPRPKLYNNAEERRVAARQKAKRYYDKNNTSIKEKKRQSRLQYQADLEKQLAREREERARIRSERMRLQTDNEIDREIEKDTRFYEGQYEELKTKLLDKVLLPSPLDYFQKLYWAVVSKTTFMECPLQTARGSFHYRSNKDSVDRLWRDTWNRIGSGALLDKITVLNDCYSSIERALDNIDLAVIEGDLEEKFHRRKLMFQSEFFLQQFTIESLP